MTLEQIYAQIWACLTTATREGDQPFKAMQVATIGLDGAPNLRTVLLRRVSEAENLVVFHTDVRSPKIAELSREPRIALAGVDMERNLQIRIAGEARIVRDGPVRIDAWNFSADRGLIAYRTSHAPGTPLRQPADAFDDKCNVPGPGEGFKHFCVVDVRPTLIEWLDLSAAERPVRARFVRDGDRWSPCWIAP